MKHILIIIFLSISIVFTSCLSVKQQIKRNDRHTERMFKKISRKYGNAFYINSTYATFSTVWFYSEGSVKIFKLAKGKTISIKEENCNTNEIISQVENFDFYELDKCIELDGDGFGFFVSSGENKIQRDFAVGIECIKEQELNSIFLKKIIEDIKTYNLWEIFYLN